MASDTFRALRDHLEQMFQFDENDLDFGIYRILRLKRKEVERFLDTELRQIVQDTLAHVERQEEKRQLAEVTTFVKEAGGAQEVGYLDDMAAHADELKRFIEYKSPTHQDELLKVLEQQNGETGRAEELKSRIYNHVLHFFQRYYRDGDFGHNDRSLASYKVDYPDQANYDGSDVLFHWKHKDSYYIKTSYGFHNVSFKVEDADGNIVRIEYRLEGGAGTGMAQGNNKDDRKHYAFDRIERADDGTYRAVFHLTEASTPKAEVFRAMHDEIFNTEREREREREMLTSTSSATKTRRSLPTWRATSTKSPAAPSRVREATARSASPLRNTSSASSRAIGITSAISARTTTSAFRSFSIGTPIRWPVAFTCSIKT